MESAKVELLSYVDSNSEFVEIINHIKSHLKITAKECLVILSNNLNESETIKFKIDCVLDYLHDELNTGHWSQVPIKTRQAFTICSYIKTLAVLNQLSEDTLREAMTCVDLGLLLGAPLDENLDLLSRTATCLTNHLNDINKLDIGINNEKPKRKLEMEYEQYNKIKGKEVPIISCPSIERFRKEFYELQLPVKLNNCMDHWPAMKLWIDVNYLLKVAGNRTVPIEIGSHYTDKNWSQKLMTLQNFIKDYFLKEDSENTGYLAQHNLFDQITELRNDVHIPEYCCLSRNYQESCEPDINAWFGPKNTVSPLHYDPKDNVLAQVFGTKQIILFSPKDSQYLYPYQDKLLSNTAQIDPVKPVNYDTFPNFKNAVPYKCLLKPGEMLFIPEKWWHHVTALEKSFSVSFWWK